MRYNRDMKILCAGQAVVDCITRNIDKESLKNRSARAESIRLNVGGDAHNEFFHKGVLTNKAPLCKGSWILRKQNTEGLHVITV